MKQNMTVSTLGPGDGADSTEKMLLNAYNSMRHEVQKLKHHAKTKDVDLKEIKRTNEELHSKMENDKNMVADVFYASQRFLC